MSLSTSQVIPTDPIEEPTQIDFVKKVGPQDVSLKTEFEFAETLYQKACEGLDDDPPPNPTMWLEYAPEMAKRWKAFKAGQQALLEAEDTHEEHKEDIRKFIECATYKYMELCNSIYELFDATEIIAFLDSKRKLIKWIKK